MSIKFPQLTDIRLTYHFLSVSRKRYTVSTPVINPTINQSVLDKLVNCESFWNEKVASERDAMMKAITNHNRAVRNLNFMV